MTALGAHVGAKVQRSVAWVRLHKLDDHCSCAHGAMRGRHRRQPFFRSHMVPFRGRINQGMRGTLLAGTTIGGTNRLMTLSRSGRLGAPPSFSHLAIAADGVALTSEMFVIHVYGYDNDE